MNQCLLCGNVINSEISLSFLLSFKAYHQKRVCSQCLRKFKLIGNEHCQYCGKGGHFASQICDDCRLWLKSDTAWFRNHSLYYYNPMMKEFMQQYKFQGDYRLRRIFQPRFQKTIQSLHRVVIPIPLHQNTYRQRGFNQVIGLLGNMNYVEALQTIKKNKNRAQSQKKREERLRLTQPFKIVPNKIQQLRGKDVVVVDDVYTTGATIRSAARLLKSNQVHSVIGLTLAH